MRLLPPSPNARPFNLAAMIRCLAVVSLFVSAALAQQPTPCTFEKSVPTCNKAAFAKTLAAAHTAAFNEASLTPNAVDQMAHFLNAIGKQLDPGKPDLVFQLTQPSPDGIFVGPAGIELARLRVYSPGIRPRLLWEESYTDQPDVPWPSAVLYLLQQFRDRFK